LTDQGPAAGGACAGAETDPVETPPPMAQT
jgi:hypothetical protein